VRSPFLRIILIALVLASSAAWAQDGLRGIATNDAQGSSALRSSFEQRLVVADFDNDQRPDGAILTDAGQLNGQRSFRIDLHLTAGDNNTLTFQSSETALTISALDVNHDGATDIVVEQAFTRRRLEVWLNDGHGIFRKARSEDFPSAYEPVCQWGAPLGRHLDLVLALAKSGSDHPVLILQVLRFDSSSSNWRVRVQPPFARLHNLNTRSPRGPPSSHSL